MIYLDNTIHGGYSYDFAVKAVRDMATAFVHPGDGADIPDSDRTKRKGVYSSQDLMAGPNTTAIMAKTVSRFFQLWFDECVIHDIPCAMPVLHKLCESPPALTNIF